MLLQNGLSVQVHNHVQVSDALVAYFVTALVLAIGAVLYVVGPRLRRLAIWRRSVKPRLSPERWGVTPPDVQAAAVAIANTVVLPSELDARHSGKFVYTPEPEISRAPKTFYATFKGDDHHAMRHYYSVTQLQRKQNQSGAPEAIQVVVAHAHQQIVAREQDAGLPDVPDAPNQLWEIQVMCMEEGGSRADHHDGNVASAAYVLEGSAPVGFRHRQDPNQMEEGVVEGSEYWLVAGMDRERVMEHHVGAVTEWRRSVVVRHPVWLHQ